VATSDPRFPAHFDHEPWEEDLARCTGSARGGETRNAALLTVLSWTDLLHDYG
jgi:hypothetical protein